MMFWILFTIESICIVLMLYGAIIGMLFEIALLKIAAGIASVIAIIVLLGMAYIVSKGGK